MTYSDEHLRTPGPSDRLHPEGSDWRASRDWAYLLVFGFFALVGFVSWLLDWLTWHGWVSW